jgi:hypothetical protein
MNTAIFFENQVSLNPAFFFAVPFPAVPGVGWRARVVPAACVFCGAFCARFLFAILVASESDSYSFVAKTNDKMNGPV